jgi:hypothetical protein
MFETWEAITITISVAVLALCALFTAIRHH